MSAKRRQKAVLKVGSGAVPWNLACKHAWTPIGSALPLLLNEIGSQR
jgi:hypothetical protein